MSCTFAAVVATVTKVAGALKIRTTERADTGAVEGAVVGAVIGEASLTCATVFNVRRFCQLNVHIVELKKTNKHNQFKPRDDVIKTVGHRTHHIVDTQVLQTSLKVVVIRQTGSDAVRRRSAHLERREQVEEAEVWIGRNLEILARRPIGGRHVDCLCDDSAQTVVNHQPEFLKKTTTTCNDVIKRIKQKCKKFRAYPILFDEFNRMPRAIVNRLAHTERDVTSAEVDHCSNLSVLQVDGDAVGIFGGRREGSVVKQNST